MADEKTQAQKDDDARENEAAREKAVSEAKGSENARNTLRPASQQTDNAGK